MRKSTLSGICCILVAGILTIAAGIGSAVNGKWFKNSDIKTWFNSWGKGSEIGQPEDADDIVAVNSDGEALRAGCTYEMTDEIVLLSSDVAVDDTQVSAGGKGFALTPTLSNEYINGEYDWSLEYVDPAPDQNTDVAINDCILLETVGADGKQVKIFSLRSFNCPIKLTAKLRGTDATDSCVFSCVKRVSAIRTSGCFNDFNCGSYDYDFGYSLQNSGIHIGDLYLKSIQMSCLTEFQDAMRKYLTFDISFKESTYNCNINVTSDMLECVEEGENYTCSLTLLDSAFDYSSFIVNFDNYDDAHKQAIYFAWYQAAKVVKFDNMYIRADFEYLYKGYSVENISSDCENGTFSGETLGEKAIPNVTLNGNYVFT